MNRSAKRSIAIVTAAAMMLTLLVFGAEAVSQPASAASTSSYVTAYTNVPYMYVSEDKGGSTTTVIPYKSKVRVYGSIARKSEGRYVKIKYDGEFYYKWIAANEKPFVKKGISFRKYRKACRNKMQKRIVRLAKKIRGKKTVYSHNTPGSIKNGKMCFDCSGFASYVINNAMTFYVPPYKVSANITTLDQTEDIYTAKGSTSAGKKFKAKVVCTGKPNFKKLQPGDIVFFNERGNGVDHCGVYLGNKEFIHSTKRTDGVSIMPLKDSYAERFVEAKRVVPASKPKPILAAKYLAEYANVYKERTLNGKCTQLPTGTKVYVRYKYSLRITGQEADCAYVSYRTGSRVKKYGYIMLNHLANK